MVWFTFSTERRADDEGETACGAAGELQRWASLMATVVYEAVYSLSVRQMRKAFIELMWLGRSSQILATVFLFAAAVYIGVVSEDLLWVSGFLAGLALGYAFFMMRAYLHVLKRAKGISLTLQCDDYGIHFTTSHHTSSFAWISLSRLAFTRSFLLITLLPNRQPAFVPLAAIPTDMLDFIKLHDPKAKKK